MEPSLRVVRAVRVNIEIDDLDTARRLLMTIAAVPWTFTELDVADIGQKEAAPLAATR